MESLCISCQDCRGVSHGVVRIELYFGLEMVFCWTFYLAIPSLISFGLYAAYLFVRSLFSPQDLKKAYGATWAVVTGGSSGIGLAIVERLALQSINVAVVALDDAILDKAIQELMQKFPETKFVKVGVDLSQGDYMSVITEKTKSLPINLVFNNAGFIKLGHFADMPLDAQLRNFECNATSAIKITHHFLNQMIDRKQKGLISFTSSSACFFSNPISTLYGSTKAFLTEFGASLAGEVKDLGIDVVVVHPSPINSNFYQNATGVSAVKFFQSTANSPSVVVDSIFTSAGRFTIWDQGYFTILVRFLLKVLDWNFLVEIIALTARLNADHLKLRKPRSSSKEN